MVASLDGFIARKDGSVDWLHFSKDVQQIMADYWGTIDTILMGRKTYEMMLRDGHRVEGEVYVFSRTLAHADWANSRYATAVPCDYRPAIT